MARFIAQTQQKYTQRGGVRPFGVSGMMAGFAADGSPQLYLTDPAGTFSSWKVFFLVTNIMCIDANLRQMPSVDEMKKQ
jgi:20S proteasome alpha/beta subunit